jgi:hypothetical protein
MGKGFLDFDDQGKNENPLFFPNCFVSIVTFPTADIAEPDIMSRFLKTPLLHEWSDWNQATSAPFFRGMEV